MRITVLGAGAWGTALAKVLHENGNAVTLWDIANDTLKEIQVAMSACCDMPIYCCRCDE